MEPVYARNAQYYLLRMQQANACWPGVVNDHAASIVSIGVIKMGTIVGFLSSFGYVCIYDCCCCCSPYSVGIT